MRHCLASAKMMTSQDLKGRGSRTRRAALGQGERERTNLPRVTAMMPLCVAPRVCRGAAKLQLSHPPGSKNDGRIFTHGTSSLGLITLLEHLFAVFFCWSTEPAPFISVQSLLPYIRRDHSTLDFIRI
jgi:hypothetical protein